MNENEEEQTAKDPQAVVAARRKRLAGAGAQVNPDEPQPVSQAKMLNQLEVFDLPSGLTLELKALPVKKMRELTQMITLAWPIDGQIIALTNPTEAGGFDVPAILVMMQETTGQTFTERDIAASIAGLNQAFSEEGSTHLSGIADCLLMLAPDGTDKESIVAALEEATVPQLVDVLRMVWSVSGGFPGDLRSRFG